MNRKNWEKKIRNIAWQNLILENMIIACSLNPYKVKVDYNMGVILDEIVKAYSTNNRTHKTDEVILKVRYIKAM